MSTKTLTLIAVISLFFVACMQGNKTEKSGLSLQDSLIEDAKGNSMVDSISLLRGSWVQPNPINDKEEQGFTLNSDSTAKSINMYTLLYKKWWLEHNKLYLIAESIGNKVSSTDTASYEILKLNEKELVLKNRELIMSYKKQ